MIKAEIGINMPNVSKVSKGGLVSLLEASRSLPFSYLTLLNKVKRGQLPPVKSVVNGVFLVDQNWIDEVKKTRKEAKTPTFFTPRKRSTAIPITTTLLLEVAESLSVLENKLITGKSLGSEITLLDIKIGSLLSAISIYNISGVDTSRERISYLTREKDRLTRTTNPNPDDLRVTELKNFVKFYNYLLAQLTEFAE